MSVFLHGKYYWFEFTFHGVRYRQSTKSKNEGVAEKIEREHRRALELGQVGLFDKNKKGLLFSTEVKAYIELMQPHWKLQTRKMHYASLQRTVSKDGTVTYGTGKLLGFFAKMLLTDITAKTIQEYQAYRAEQLTERGTPPSNRTINIELTLVRQLLDHHKLWLKLKEGSKLKMLKENQDAGRALSKDELQRLLQACRQSNSRGLYYAVLLSAFTGLRSFELKALRWKQVDLLNGTVTVGKSKSDAGEGRVISLGESALELIRSWRSNFVALPNHCVFPSQRYKNGKVVETFLSTPIGKFQHSWSTARKAAGVECRWHDLRHTAASIMGESGASDATMLSHFGWSSTRMKELYSHAREQARKLAATYVDTVVGKIVNQQNSIQ